MKILLLSFEYPPETGFGGIGTYTWYQARALVKLGLEVHVLAGTTKPMALNTTTHDGVFVHRFRANDFVMKLAGFFGTRGWFWTRQRIENAWCMYRGLMLLRKQHAFDIIEMPECGAEGALINLLVDIPTVVRFHSPSQLIMPFYDVSDVDIAMCSWMERLAIRHASALTSCSAYLAGEVRDRLSVGCHIDVIANGIDLALFDREPVADLTASYGVTPGQVTILFAGRMERRKGIELCAEIVTSVLSRRDVTFLFAGEDLFGYVENTLKPALAGKPLLGSFRYLGKLGLDEVRACVRAVDIHLLPSLWENCPYSCLEAMVSSRAIVASDQGGMPELIQHGVNGLLAESGSSQSYVLQLLKLIDETELRHRLGIATRSTIEDHYKDVQIGKRTIAVYSRVAE